MSPATLSLVAMMTRHMLLTAIVIVVMAFTSQVTSLLEFGEGGCLFRGDTQEDASEQDSVNALDGSQGIILKQHPFFENEVGNAFAAWIDHHEAEPSNLFAFFTIDGTADVQVGHT